MPSTARRLPSAEAEDGGDVPNQHLLNELHRADRALFKFKGSRYATDCGHNNQRQPVVVTRDELTRIDAAFPGAHSGAVVDYGSSAAAAAKNAYICPKVWCPRSRTALSMAQFEALGRKCPNPEIDEEPMVSDDGYFKGRERYPGFLDGRKHPAQFCMPCCFLKPAQRIDKCPPGQLQQHLQSVVSPAADRKKRDDGGVRDNRDIRDNRDNRDAQSGDAKYIRGDTAPLEEGRYGVLPHQVSQALDSRRCGNRDDGSGQIMVNNHCFVRRGVAAGMQPPGPNTNTNTAKEPQQQRFLACAAVALDNPAFRDAAGLVAAIVAHLSAAEFVTLEGGRVARHFLDGVDPEALLATDADRLGVAAWLENDASYVARYGLQPLIASLRARGGKGGRGDPT